jgi:hypothetical protein
MPRCPIDETTLGPQASAEHYRTRPLNPTRLAVQFVELEVTSRRRKNCIEMSYLEKIKRKIEILKEIKRNI